MTNPKRLMVFIDGSNLYHAAGEHQPGFKVDYQKLAHELSNGYDLIRTYCYASTQVPPIEQQTKFYEKLRHMGIQTTVKPLNHGREKGVDVALVTELLILCFENAYDVAIIVSGDSDFISAIQEVKRKGKQVIVAQFNQGFSNDLKMSCDKVIYLESIAGKIKM
jgi:uncharacterized protein (TIGR00288 family)